MSASAFHARGIENDGELRALGQIDAEGYGDSSISMDSFRSWWLACPKALTALFENGQVAGGLGCWPLPAATFEALTSGQILESQIAESGFGDVATSRHWYVSGVILRPGTRGNRKALLTLLEKGLRGPLEARHPANEVQVAALGYSPEGRALGRGLGLREKGIFTRDGLPVFACTAQDLGTSLGRVARLRERLAARVPAADPPRRQRPPAAWCFGRQAPALGQLSSRQRQSA